MIALLFDPNAWLALATLTALEVVLGIDNLVFISLLTSRCEPRDARRVRQIGLSLAFLFRIMMLFGLTWLMGLTAPLFSLFGIGISWRDIILIGGGAFLIAKATHEIHREIEGREEQAPGDTSAPAWSRPSPWRLTARNKATATASPERALDPSIRLGHIAPDLTAFFKNQIRSSPWLRQCAFTSTGAPRR